MARFIRVSTIAFGGVESGADYKTRLRDKMVADLELAAQAKPDLIALPETFNMGGYPWEQWPDNADTIPGPLFDAAAEVAAKHKCYICLPILENDGGKLFNTAAFIDRAGNCIGKYHKYQPTIGEIEAGIIPGVDAETFDTDFGKVGAAICFDLKFNEVGARLAANGAQLVVFASAFIGGDRLLHWARDYGFYILSSCTARSYLVDMAGRFLGDTGWEHNQVRSGLLPPILSQVINIDRMHFHLDYNQNKFQDILKKYGPGVEIENHYPEAHFTMASLMDDVTVADIVKEFELETWTEYVKRARGVRLEYLRKYGYDV